MYDMVNMKKLPALGGKAPKAFEAFVALHQYTLDAALIGLAHVVGKPIGTE
jgi:hypothetical protein